MKYLGKINTFVEKHTVTVVFLRGKKFIRKAERVKTFSMINKWPMGPSLNLTKGLISFFFLKSKYETSWKKNFNLPNLLLRKIQNLTIH